VNLRKLNVENFFRAQFGGSFDFISLKLDILVGTMKNWSHIVFGPNRPQRGQAGSHANLRIFKNESLPPDSAEAILRKMK